MMLLANLIAALSVLFVTTAQLDKLDRSFEYAGCYKSLKALSRCRKVKLDFSSHPMLDCGTICSNLGYRHFALKANFALGLETAKCWCVKQNLADKADELLECSNSDTALFRIRIVDSNPVAMPTELILASCGASSHLSACLQDCSACTALRNPELSR